jgi:hypothetical protein
VEFGNHPHFITTESIEGEWRVMQAKPLVVKAAIRRRIVRGMPGETEACGGEEADRCASGLLRIELKKVPATFDSMVGKMGQDCQDRECR